MAIAILTENLAVHQSMADEPNGDDGITAGELKAKFDQAALAIQKYLNETVVPAVNAAGGGVRTVNGLAPGPDGNVNVATRGGRLSGLCRRGGPGGPGGVAAQGRRTGDGGPGDLRRIEPGGCALTGAAGTLTLEAGRRGRGCKVGPAGIGIRRGQPGLCGPGMELAGMVGHGAGGKRPPKCGQSARMRPEPDALDSSFSRTATGVQCRPHGTTGGGAAGPVPASLGPVRRRSGSLGVAATKAEMEADFRRCRRRCVPCGGGS
ncbi:MAG: hypothetical protein ACLU9S_24380 [Oscillospiraceae bacterium]